MIFVPLTFELDVSLDGVDDSLHAAPGDDVDDASEEVPVAVAPKLQRVLVAAASAERTLLGILKE